MLQKQTDKKKLICREMLENNIKPNKSSMTNDVIGVAICSRGTKMAKSLPDECR